MMEPDNPKIDELPIERRPLMFVAEDLDIN
jgi:hypothetical protein